MKKTYKKISTYSMVGFVILVLLITTCSASVTNENMRGYSSLTKTIVFSAPQIHQIIRENQRYDQVIIPDSPGAWNVGEPDLPAYGVSFLLPAGTTVVDINVHGGTKISLGTGYNVAPTEQPVALSDVPSYGTGLLKNLTIYSSETIFPSSVFSHVGTYCFRGYTIFVLLLYPVQYQPISGQLSYFTDMSVTLQTIQTDIVNPLYRGLEKDWSEVRKKVDCIDALPSYAPYTAPREGTGYDLLILTTDDLKEGFVPLKEAHDAQGTLTEIKTLTDVSIFPNQVTADTIRDFIRDEYTNNGIEYVLIGGDSDVVPVKMLWAQAGQETTTMPSDLFYACLDGPFDYNENDKWGEPHDGEGGGDVDLIAEVYVGRAPVSDLTETNNFVQKTISYMNSDGYSNGVSLMAGEYLWGPPDYAVTFGDDSMEELINGSSANQYKTVGIPPNEYTFDRLYDHDWPGFNLEDPWNTGWTTSDIVNRINNGICFVNHLGHSNTGYNMRMVSADVEGLTNTILPFIYSQGCYAGAFDEGDCIGEYFTVKTTHAALAVVMCARYGWGSPGSTNGPSQRYHRYFWDAVFGENILSIGKANQDSKEENVKKINGQCMRWCYYQMNLLGDPAVTFFTGMNEPPGKPTQPSGMASGQIKQSYIYTTSATDSDNDTLFYKWSFGDGTFSDWIGPYSSGEEVSIFHNWSKRGRYEVKVKVRDEHRSESDWSDPLPVTMPFIPRFSVMDFILKILQQHFPRVYFILHNYEIV